MCTGLVGGDSMASWRNRDISLQLEIGVCRGQEIRKGEDAWVVEA